MIVVEVLLIAAVLFAVAAVAAGRGDLLGAAPRDLADLGLPAKRPIRSEDLSALRFSMALRGYRMAEVDEVLDRVSAELADRDERIATLEAGAAATAPTLETSAAATAPTLPTEGSQRPAATEGCQRAAPTEGPLSITPTAGSRRVPQEDQG